MSFFVGLNNSLIAQLNQKEEILRHIEMEDKLVSHIYERTDTVKWGYFFGHSRFWDYEWAEKYQISGKAYVTGVIAHIKGSNATDKKGATFSVYNVHTDMKPDKAIYTKNLTYKDINIDGSATTIMFDSSIVVADSFFVSFGVADYVHTPEVWGNDTMHLLGSEADARDEEDLKIYGRNCIRTHSNIPELAWIDVYNGGWNTLNAYMAIYPIMDFSYGTKNTFINQGNFRIYKSYYNKISKSVEMVLSSKKTTSITIKLFDLTGKEIIRSNIEMNGNNQKTYSSIKIPENVSPGNYILFLMGKGITSYQKVVIP